MLNDALIIILNLLLFIYFFYPSFSKTQLFIPFVFFVFMFFNHFKVYNNVVRFISIKSVSKLSYSLFLPYLLACTVLFFIDISLSKIFFIFIFFHLV